MTLQLASGWPLPSGTVTPVNFNITRYNVSISGNTTVDINLPVVKVSGVVTGPDGSPVANATVQLDSVVVN